MNGGQSARVILTSSALIFQVDRSRTVQPKRADRPGLTFSNSTDRFQTVFIAATRTADRPAMGRGPSSCAQKLC
jgi:hypothetical protein